MEEKESLDCLMDEKFKDAICQADMAGCGSMFCTCEMTPIENACARYWHIVRKARLDPEIAMQYWKKYIVQRKDNPESFGKDRSQSQYKIP